MNSFMPWVGGKRALRDIVIACFPPTFDRYIEVFGGAGWVLFHKRPSTFEVYNDYNSLLANLFRCVRDKNKIEQLKETLRYVLNSREDFNIILDLFARGVPMSDVDKAAKFYQLIRFSYAAGCTSFNCQPHDMRSNFPVFDAASHRLREVIVENKDFADLVRQYDKPDTFFYLDPPYFGTEKHYQHSNFDRDSHQRLFDALMAIESHWLLSYGDEIPIRELYDVPGIYILPISRINNIKQRYEGGSEFPEILIANYDILERYNQFQPEQLMLA